MAPRGIFLASLLLSCLVQASYGNTLFSSLKKTLQVNASPKNGDVLKVGEKMTVTWGLNQSAPAGVDSTYKKVEVKLCYAPISQVDRPWRKTEEELSKDRTCQFKIVERPYIKKLQTFEWTIERDVPFATFFVRAYALDAAGQEVAFGQTTDDHKTTNLFQIHSITGRHVSLDIASVCFSVFSVVSLFVFFYLEKRKGKASRQK
ncbi:high-affinity nitrate transporter 3.2-like [Carica papaya]|uniref:high-affinity nitrate transporter 3.2-like n=1 Tax=Carica papaya TaxID=3649 RepID=UPI000B8CA5C5|nr:high-affinity nitrate transporter 3.2-like [Carica papaya]